MCLGLALAASPLQAKKRPPAPVANPLPTIVNPDPAHAPENVLYLDLSNGGRVTVRLMPEWAPGHVERIKTLVGQGFYNGIIFHRVIDGFMAQTGDPTGTGQGGSQLPDLKAEFNAMPHLRGTLSMARTDQPDSANSQFFIVFYPRFALDRKYTVFGRVIGGMDVVDRRTAREADQNRPGLDGDRQPPAAASHGAGTGGDFGGSAQQFDSGAISKVRLRASTDSARAGFVPDSKTNARSA
jgi:cyclophilin family peptidyl-prolyl cis-trans isomerase